MNRVYILGHGLPAQNQTRPEFRKATKNMVWVQTAVEAALGDKREAIGEQLGLVLGSSHGELDVTMQFLKTLDETGVARPILFQNSLHNSTTGFATLNLKITGPMLTVSDLSFTGEDALAAAMDFLHAGLCDHCLVVGVESRVQVLETGSSPETGEGAGALLLCNSAGLERCGFKPIAELTGLRINRVAPIATEVVGGYYESKAIERLVRALAETNETRLRLQKPNGSWSEIEWHRE